MNRRKFFNLSARGAVGLAVVSWGTAKAVTPTPPLKKLKRPELRISRIVIQEAKGRRLTPVAPNAYAAYRGYDVREPVVRIQAAAGLEGVAHNPVKPELLKPLLGLDPFA